VSEVDIRQSHPNSNTEWLDSLSTCTLILKRDVTYRQYFINQQNLRFQMSCGGEGEAHIHAAGVALNGRVEKFLNPCKIDNLIELLRDLDAFHAQDSPVQENVLSAG
jgi:hypothetical protein